MEEGSHLSPFRNASDETTEEDKEAQHKLLLLTRIQPATWTE